MNGPRHPFGSVKEAATQLHRAAGAAGASLHPLPFNRFSQDDTDWWLSPEPGNPAYRFAKFAITAGPSAAPGDLFVGLSFEKGIGPSAAEFFELNARGRRRVMDRDWAWGRTLVPALRSGAFAESAAAAEATAGEPLTVYLAAIYMQPSRGWDDQADVRSMGWDNDEVRFEYSDGSLRLIDQRITADLLGGMVSARTFADVVAALDGMPRRTGRGRTSPSACGWTMRTDPGRPSGRQPTSGAGRASRGRHGSARGHRAVVRRADVSSSTGAGPTPSPGRATLDIDRTPRPRGRAAPGSVARSPCVGAADAGNGGWMT